MELRQLPAPPRMFTGRTRELAHLSEALNGQTTPGSAMAISVIGGTDGQLHVNLRGFDPTGQPMTPTAAVRGFLDTLGVDPAVIPSHLEAQAALYRSLVAGKRVLIVLDNAYDTAQVTPLLPGSPMCAVLITSRRRLAGLVAAHGAHSLDLDVLSQSEGRALLARHLGGDRLAAESDATARLLDCCAGLPLALGIVAARVTSHPDFPLTALADELQESADRLDALDGGDLTTNLRAVLSWSHHALSTDAAAVFGLLGLAPGPVVSLQAARSLTALPMAQVRAALRDLDNAHLIHQDSPGRYRMHDLVRLYATERGRTRPMRSNRSSLVSRSRPRHLTLASATTFGCELLVSASGDLDRFRLQVAQSILRGATSHP